MGLYNWKKTNKSKMNSRKRYIFLYSHPLDYSTLSTYIMAMNKKREEEERKKWLPKGRILNLSSGIVTKRIDFIIYTALGGSSSLCLQICLPIFYHLPISLKTV